MKMGQNFEVILVKNLNIQFFKVFKRLHIGSTTISEFGSLSALSGNHPPPPPPKIQPLTNFIRLLLRYEAVGNIGFVGRELVCAEKSGENGREHGRINSKDTEP
jgi:hypothetical protein